MTGCLLGILRYFTLMQLVYAYKVQTITQMTSLFWFRSFVYYDKPTKTDNLHFVTKWSFSSRIMWLLFDEIQILIWPKPRFVWDKDSEFVWHDLKHSKLSIKVWVLKVWYHCTTWNSPSWNFDESVKHTVWTIPFKSNDKNLGLKNGRPFSEYFLLTRDLRTIQTIGERFRPLLNLIVWRSEDTYGSKMNG